jgi:hypothetical protein
MCVLLCLPAAAHGQRAAAGLSARELAKAAELLDALGRIETHDADALRQRAASVRDSARRLPECDVRADIEAAARLLESSALSEPDAGSRRPSCAAERPGAHARLCAESQTTDELRRRQARLHLAWATAFVRRARGTPGAGDAEALAEAAAERIMERALAESAFEALKQLESTVVVYRTRADFEEGGTLARVSHESFDGRFARAAREVATIIEWLPETRLRAELRNALRSYADGHFWWARARCARVVDAGGDCVRGAERWRLGDAYPGAAAYSVAVNWRNASKHLERAARLLGPSPALLTQKGAAPSPETAPDTLLFKP